MKKRCIRLAVLASLAWLMVFGPGLAGAAEIGVAWVGKSGMALRVLGGFEKGMKEMAPDISMDVHKELGTLDDLAALVETFQREKQGMVILRSNGAKWLGTNPPSIPTFIGGCNNPVQLGAMKNMEAPEGKITGVTYFLPVETQFETFKAILPGMTSLLLLYGSKNPSQAIDRKETQAICKTLGLEYHEKGVETREQAIAAVKELGGSVSFVILGNQALVIDNAKDIVAAAGKTPVVSYSSKPVKDGALGGFVADDETLGMMLADSVVDVLVKGKAIKDVPVKVDPAPKFYVNAKTAQTLGVEIPFEVLQAAKVIE